MVRSSGNSAEALVIIKKTLVLERTRRPGLYVAQAEIYLEIGDLKSARLVWWYVGIHFHEHRKIAERKVCKLLYMHGQVMLCQQRFDEALIMFKDSTKYNEDCFVSILVCMIELGQTRCALQTIDVALTTGSRIANTVIGCCVQLPTNSEFQTDLYLIRARLRSCANNMLGALNDARAALKLKPGYLPALEIESEVLHLIDVQYGQALSAADQNEFEAALVKVEQVLQVLPHNSRFLALRGSIFMERAEYQKTIDGLLTVVEIQQRQTDKSKIPDQEAQLLLRAFADYGTLVLNEGDSELALKLATQGLCVTTNRTPKVANLYVLRGDAYDHRGESSNALADYYEALEIVPEDDYVRLKVSLVYHSLGVKVYEAEMFDEAEFSFSHAIEARDGVAHFYTSRGLVRLYIGLINEAEDDGCAALSLYPESEAVVALASRLFSSSGDLAMFEKPNSSFPLSTVRLEDQVALKGKRIGL